MKNLKVKSKMLILVCSIFITVLIAGVIALSNLKEAHEESMDLLDNTIRRDYDSNIKEQVKNVISLLDTIYNDYQEGIYTLEEAQKLSADLVREMRYKDGGYFWIDTIDGTNLVLLGKEKEGTNRLADKDANGYEMVKEIIRVGQEADGGFTNYVFPKEGESEHSPKRSYSKLFEPYGWVVGTGNYVDYIDDIIAEQTIKAEAELRDTTIIFTIILAGLLALIGVIAISISINISSSVTAAMKYLEPITDGDFTQELPKKLSNRKDEFGFLS